MSKVPPEVLNEFQVDLDAYEANSRKQITAHVAPSSVQTGTSGNSAEGDNVPPSVVVEVAEDAEGIRAVSPAEITVEGLAADIAQLLTLLGADRLSYPVVKQVVVSACWWVSNLDLRRENCPHRSLEADAILRKAGGWVAGELEHDHVVPRRIIVDRIMRLGPDPDTHNIVRLLQWSFECVVAKREHLRLPRSTMPANWDEKNLWVRYQLADPIVQIVGGFPGVS